MGREEEMLFPRNSESDMRSNCLEHCEISHLGRKARCKNGVRLKCRHMRPARNQHHGLVARMPCGVRSVRVLTDRALTLWPATHIVSRKKAPQVEVWHLAVR